jgi:uncharacterized protein
MRIAIDIDSTLHHYWDRLSDAALRRFGIDLPYEEQIDWGITRLRPDQLAVCIEETHGPEAILAGEPYPRAVETVARWREDGHVIHIASHRHAGAREATLEWLVRIGLPFDELHCTEDKVDLCVELGVGLLIDDSPVNLARALERGMRVATIAHPWNRDVREEEDILSAADWQGLAIRLDPLLRKRVRPGG